MALIVLEIVGVVLAAFSLYLKQQKKWIGIVGLVLNLIPLIYLTLLFLAFG